MHGLSSVRRWCAEVKSNVLHAGHCVQCTLIYNVFADTSNNEDKLCLPRLNLM